MGVLEKDEKTGLRFVRLNCGRRICYQEKGVPGREAKRQLLVLHGVGSCRLAGMPGVSDEILRGYGVRVIAIDRPGYGRSDNDRKQTLRSMIEDVEEIADSLQMGEKIWLLGYSGGGLFCYAAAYHIPHRIAGIVCWAPVGNMWWKGISHGERKAWLATLTPNSRLYWNLGRWLPRWAKRVYTLCVRPGWPWVRYFQKGMADPDMKFMQNAEHREFVVDDNLESLCGNGNRGYGMYKDSAFMTEDWGFQPDDIAKSYHGKFHIFEGTVDMMVPLGMQRWVKKTIPGLVDLHEIPGEGHMSWFCYNDEGHHQTFETLFGESRESAGFPPKKV